VVTVRVRRLRFRERAFERRAPFGRQRLQLRHPRACVEPAAPDADEARRRLLDQRGRRRRHGGEAIQLLGDRLARALDPLRQTQ